jgi:predicted AAA+ superfamily ATPase
VKVLTGVRRCGKSTLMSLFRNELFEQGVRAEQILEVSLEHASAASLCDPLAFKNYITERLPEKAPAYLFVDEVQELESWAQVINGIRAEYGLDVYVTGSNSRMFSGEHLTYLSGRYVRIEVYPLSLAELAIFKGISMDTTSSVERLYEHYVTEGAFPAVALAKDVELASAILDGLYDSVFSRDIILRGKIRNEGSFLRVAAYVLDNIGSQTSANKIANSLKSAGHSISTDTVDAYLKLMCSAYLLYRCDRFDIRGKERLKTNGKYYVADQGLRNRVLGLRSGNRGHVTENVVFLELIRRGFDVSVGTLPNSEVDFIAQDKDTRCYIQVSETALDPAVLAREIEPFSSINDAFPRILITKDHTDFSTEGIRHINLYDFLLGEPL